jgi:alkane 1-monooxygenase
MSLAKKASFLLVYLLISLPLIGYALGGGYILLPILIVFGLIPTIDYWFCDTSNPSTKDYQQLLKERYFRYITFAYVPIQLAMICTSIYLVATHSLSVYEWIGFCISVGVVSGGVGINIAHELMHKNDALQQTLSKILLASVCYGHFFIEHIRGHHVNVATPLDSASARYGESLYRFIPRTLVGSFKSAWKLELKRLAQKGYNAYGMHNNFWWILLVPLTVCLITFSIFGFFPMVFFLLQGFVAALMLEIVNYIEHYGLARKQLDNGKFERVSTKHSWNANHWLTNSLLFHLQRHSDHHTHAGRPYQVLRHIEESPQLPNGYPGMVVLALIPRLWFKIMNPKVDAYNNLTNS